MEGNSNLKELLKKLTRNQKLKIVHGEEQLQIILDQLNASDDLQVNSQQTLDVFNPLSDIIPQESRYQIEEKSKEEVKEEINQDKPDESLTDAQLIKLSKEDKAKRYNRVETLLSMGYSVQQIAEDAQVNMSLSTVKRLKSKVREHGSIIREEGSGRPTKLLEIHQDFILKLLNDSPFNTCKRIALKLKNKHGIGVDRTTISRFLVDKGFKWKGPQIVFRNNEKDQQNRLEFCLKNKDRNWEDVLITDEVSFYLWSPGKNRWVAAGDTYQRTKTKYSNKVHAWGAFSSKGVIELQFFTGNMDSEQYIKMLSIANSEIWKLHPNGFILLWDNDSKHRSDISLNYYIENNIQLLEWPAYSPDLNPIENIWGNIKNNLGSKVYNKIESIKSDIEDYWKIWASNYSTKAIETMKKRIDACILLKGKRTGY